MVSILRFVPNRKGNEFVIRLCASEVDGKPIHSDELHLKASTIDNIHTVLHQVLDMAVDDMISIPPRRKRLIPRTGAVAWLWLFSYLLGQFFDNRLLDLLVDLFSDAQCCGNQADAACSL